MAEKILNQFYEGRTIRSFAAYFETKEYLGNHLSQAEKELWVKVFEAFFSRGDSRLNSDDLALGFMEVIDRMNLGIKKDAVDKKHRDPDDDDDEEELDDEDELASDVRYYLVKNREDGEEYILFDDERKISVFHTLRTMDVFALQYDWVIFHFGSKVAMYFSKIEEFKTLLVEVSRPLTGDIQKREEKMVLRSKISVQIELLQKAIDRIRWELFGIPEEKIKEILTTNRHQDLTRRRKEYLQNQSAR